MAQLLKPSPALGGANGRISQLLPSVKCSNCNKPVPLDELGDHICAPQAPSLPKPTTTLTAATALLPARLQKLVAPLASTSSSPSPEAPPIIRSSSGPSQPLPPSQSSQSHRSRSNNNLRLNVLGGNGAPAPRVRSPLGRSDPLVPDPDPSQVHSRRPSGSNPKQANASVPFPRRSSSRSRESPNHRPTSRTGGEYKQAPSSVEARARTPSNAEDSRSRTPSTHVRSSSGLSDSGRAQPSAARSHGRTPSRSSNYPDRTSSKDPRSETPSNSDNGAGVRSRTPSARNDTRSRTPSNANADQYRRQPSTSSAYPPRAPSASYRSPHTGPVVPPPASFEEIDTKSGGEAGMAGVGRRGFAAAARAALFTTQTQTQKQYQASSLRQPSAPDPPSDIPSMSSRRPNASHFLGINTAGSTSSRAHSDPSTLATTPPLSAGSGYSSPGPASPLSPGPPPEVLRAASSGRPGDRGRLASFDKHRNNNLPEINTSAANAKYERSATSRPQLSPLSPESDYDDLNSRLANSVDTKKSLPREPLSPTSVSSEAGLAYADSGSEAGASVTRSDRLKHDSPQPSLRKALNTSTSSVSPDNRSVSGERSGMSSKQVLDDKPREGGHSRDGSSTHTRAISSSSAVRDRERERDRGSAASASSAYSRSTSRTVETSGGRAMETLLESGQSISRRSGGRNSLVPVMLAKSKSTSAASPNEVRSFKLPTRAVTGPSKEGSRRSASTSEGSNPGDKDRAREVDKERRVLDEKGGRKEKGKAEKVCKRCEKQIEGGRWIQMDGGNVLCERCWKNMYLPKCRRCNLPIEKQAVSSSDGQLKGKYHRECFNCNICNKPFPDKSFYVFDGKPLCGYHYHEANNSLCAAATCGQPIEGPCAVSHAGDRYHPEHLLCEYTGHPKCRERLEEYYEVDGRMLCERHAQLGGSQGGSDSGSEYGYNSRREEPKKSSRAMKRKTRFIDLGMDLK